MHAVGKTLDGPRNGMDAEEKTLDLQVVEPRFLACPGTTPIELSDLRIVTKNETILGSCRIVLYFHIWKIGSSVLCNRLCLQCESGI
jgi:hypothetical protein